MRASVRVFLLFFPARPSTTCAENHPFEYRCRALGVLHFAYSKPAREDLSREARPDSKCSRSPRIYIYMYIPAESVMVITSLHRLTFAQLTGLESQQSTKFLEWSAVRCFCFLNCSPCCYSTPIPCKQALRQYSQSSLSLRTRQKIAQT